MSVHFWASLVLPLARPPALRTTRLAGPSDKAPGPALLPVWTTTGWSEVRRDHGGRAEVRRGHGGRAEVRRGHGGRSEVRAIRQGPRPGSTACLNYDELVGSPTGSRRSSVSPTGSRRSSGSTTGSRRSVGSPLGPARETQHVSGQSSIIPFISFLRNIQYTHECTRNSCPEVSGWGSSWSQGWTSWRCSHWSWQFCLCCCDLSTWFSPVCVKNYSFDLHHDNIWSYLPDTYITDLRSQKEWQYVLFNYQHIFIKII